MAQKAKPKPPGKNGFNYKPQFAVIVICDDERHQAAIYEQLRDNGLKCKVVKT